MTDIDDVAPSITYSMKECYDKVIDLQRRAFGAAWPWDVGEVVREYHTAIVVEATEALAHVSWRKHRKRTPTEVEGLREESVDVLIYALALCGVTHESYEDLVQSVSKKVQYNDTRTDWVINSKDKH